MRFSIITVSFDAGEKLQKTVSSIWKQSFTDYEVIVKDGGSTDTSPERLKEDAEAERALESGKLKLIICPDSGVYDGMNQALEKCRGEYILFLNCGDVLHDRDVLKAVDREIENCKSGAEADKKTIFYGNTFCSRTGAWVHSAPEITGFTCYRNIPCHQSCFYDKTLFQKKKYDTKLKIRADYDHFLWCFYMEKANFQYMDITVADYEGGGISESSENRRRDRREHEEVIRRYMKRAELLKYKTIMLLTLAPLRRWIAESSSMSGVYHKIKAFVYR